MKVKRHSITCKMSL